MRLGIQSASHVAAALCMKSARYTSRASGTSCSHQTSSMVKNESLTCGMVVCDRCAGLCISETPELLDFSLAAVCRVYTEHVKSTLWVTERLVGETSVRGEWPDCFKLIQVNSNKHSLQPRWVKQPAQRSVCVWEKESSFYFYPVV